MTIMRAVREVVDRARFELSRIVRRGLIGTSTSGGFVQVKAGDGERFDATELWQQFGFTSRPPAGSEAIVVLVDGNPDQAIAVAGTSRADRPGGLAAGDACLHAALSGSDQAAVKCCASGDVQIYCGTGDSVYVGGSTGAESMILGDTMLINLGTFLSGLDAINLAARATTLAGQLAGWAATKGKVA